MKNAIAENLLLSEFIQKCLKSVVNTSSHWFMKCRSTFTWVNLSAFWSPLKVRLYFVVPVASFTPSQLEKEHTSTNLKVTVWGLDFGFFETGFLLPPEGSGWGFLCCIWFGFGFCVCWKNLTSCFLGLDLCGVSQTGDGVLAFCWYRIHSGFGLKICKTELDPDFKISESAHV